MVCYLESSHLIFISETLNLNYKIYRNKFAKTNLLKFRKTINRPENQMWKFRKTMRIHSFVTLVKFVIVLFHFFNGNKFVISGLENSRG